MYSTNISHKKYYEGKISDFSSELDTAHSINNILREDGTWIPDKDDSRKYEYFIIDYNEIIPINLIKINAARKDTFPSVFRIEGSLDGNNWMIIHSENDLELEDLDFQILLPIINIRFLKLLLLKTEKSPEKSIYEIKTFLPGIAGINSLSSSTSSDQAHEISMLLDCDSTTFWESRRKSFPEKEIIMIDLGNIFYVNQFLMSSSGLDICGFPENFQVEISPDKNIWTPVIEEKKFISEKSKNYLWQLTPSPARFIRIEMVSVNTGDNNYGVRLSELYIFAASMDPFHTHNIGNLTPYASTFNAGIVKLAKEGEDTPGVAVQASDRRLRDATTIFKGIVQLADKNETKDGLVVQASDPRLEPATDTKYGIVRLAYDREDGSSAVVQCKDTRLQEASETRFGIVKLCPDGIYSDLTVVTGNDARLKKATTKTYGICRLAETGEENPDSVITSNDKRLRDATTTYKGIVELAENGENIEGVAVQGNDKRLQAATVNSIGIVELAEDGEDKPGVAVQGNDCRLKEASTRTKGIVELAEDGEDKPGVVVQGNDCRLKIATAKSKGIVQLAENGEDRPGTAVQGNDRRLKDATESRMGIMKFAKDNETFPLTAVQASDSRLREATTTYKGIVELAEDGEGREGTVVQGNDRRLQDSTTTSKGIIELAEDGEDKPGVAVQGNDRRLKDATETSKGIMRFASDGEVSPYTAVQANDRRLRNATTTQKGIIKLAEDGSAQEGLAVQGNDKRLKDATTSTKGIIELAEDGEDIPGVAVQGNDNRLAPATEERAGIIRFAKHNETRKNFAVQSDDIRLSDDRNPLPHVHNYAPLKHDYNSHSGTINIVGKKNLEFKGITPPSDSSSIIFAKNESTETGSIGITAVVENTENKFGLCYGILGHSKFTGIRGQSSGNSDSTPRGCGILGVSRFGAGGVFASEHSYSLVVDGFGDITEFDDSVHLLGNGKAAFIKGKSLLKGQLLIQNINNTASNIGNIVEMFEIDDEEFISAGDILVASKKGNSILSRSREKYKKSVIGIVSGNPLLILNDNEEKRLYPVVLAGKALCKVDARERPILPGNFIVTSDTPGCGMAGQVDSFEKVGTVIGKALGSLDDGIGTIPVFITHL